MRTLEIHVTNNARLPVLSSYPVDADIDDAASRLHHISRDEVHHPWREKHELNSARIHRISRDEVHHTWREKHALNSARIHRISRDEVHHPWGRNAY